jgi:hypothetical protein
MRLYLYMFAIQQHQRRRDKKIHITPLINFFFRDSIDYCMEAWITYTVELRRRK